MRVRSHRTGRHEGPSDRETDGRMMLRAPPAMRVAAPEPRARSSQKARGRRRDTEYSAPTSDRTSSSSLRSFGSARGEIENVLWSGRRLDGENCERAGGATR